MLCDNHKAGMIEAALSNAALPDGLQQHIQVCVACRAALANQRALCRTIDSSLMGRANAELSSSFLPQLRTHIADEPKLTRRWSPAWAGVAACAILSITTMLAWNPWHTSSTSQTGPPAVASNSLPNSPQKLWRSESLLPSSTSKAQKIYKTRISGHDIRYNETDLLVAAGQKAIVDQLIDGVQRGEIDGNLLVPNSRADLQISEIEIPPIETQLAVEPPNDPLTNSEQLNSNIAAH